MNKIVKHQIGVVPAPAVSVTVCICTCDRVAYLEACLESLQRQTVGTAAFDIIVVDNGSPPAAARAIAELVAAMPNASLVRVEEAGLSRARNAGAEAASGEYIAYIDDDALAAPDWIEQILRTITECPQRPAVLGGRILPVWEAPLPRWWPESLRGVLTIIEWEGQGEFRTAELPRGLEPYGVNFIVEREALLAAGGFASDLGRQGSLLLSDEEVHLAWKIQDSGRSARYDSRIVVHHCIQAQRLTPSWLLGRLYWQAGSSVLTLRLLSYRAAVWRQLPRRLALAILLRPLQLIPPCSTRLFALRWRLAYAQGFVRMALFGKL